MSAQSRVEHPEAENSREPDQGQPAERTPGSGGGRVGGPGQALPGRDAGAGDTQARPQVVGQQHEPARRGERDHSQRHQREQQARKETSVREGASIEEEAEEPDQEHWHDHEHRPGHERWMPARRAEAARHEHEQRQHRAGPGQRQRRGRRPGIAQGQGQRGEQQHAGAERDPARRIGERVGPRGRARQFDRLDRAHRVSVAAHGPGSRRLIRCLDRSWSLRRSRHSRSRDAAARFGVPVVSGRSSRKTG